MKFEPVTVSFSPTLICIGLTEVTVGAVGTGFFLAADAPGLSTSRALRSAPRQRTTRREFIVPYFGRLLDELERRSSTADGLPPGLGRGIRGLERR
jgi:hypothetical protein